MNLNTIYYQESKRRLFAASNAMSDYYVSDDCSIIGMCLDSSVDPGFLKECFNRLRKLVDANDNVSPVDLRKYLFSLFQSGDGGFSLNIEDYDFSKPLVFNSFQRKAEHAAKKNEIIGQQYIRTDRCCPPSFTTVMGIYKVATNENKRGFVYMQFPCQKGNNAWAVETTFGMIGQIIPEGPDYWYPLPILPQNLPVIGSSEPVFHPFCPKIKSEQTKKDEALLNKIAGEMDSLMD